MKAIRWISAALVLIVMTAVIAVGWPPTFPPSYLSQQGGQIVYLPTPTPTSTPPPPQLIQQNSAQAATGTSAQVSMVSPCTTGNLVVLTWGSAALSTNAIASSVSNLGNATWTKVTSGLNSGNGTAEIWSATCGTTPGTTSTITFPASTNPTWNMSEWRGFTATQDTGSGTNPSPQFSNSSYNTPNIITTNANDLLIAMSSTSASFPVVSSPYSGLNTTNVFQQGEFQIVSATGTYPTNYTGGAGNTQVSAFAAFKAPAMTVPLSIVGTPTTATSTTTTCTVSPPAPTVATDALFGYVFSGSNTITDNAGMTDLGNSVATGTGWYVDLRGILLSGAPPTSVIFTTAANTINFCELISFAGISNSITKDPAANNPSSAAVSNLVPSSASNGLTSMSNGDLMFFGAGQTINAGTFGTFGAPTPTLTGGSWANGIQSNTAGQATEMWWSAQTTAGQTGTVSSTMGCTSCTSPRSTGALWSVLANGTSSPPPTLVSIAVTPNPATITGVPGTQQFAATGTYSDNSMTTVTSSCNPWASSNTSIATIGASTGLATSVAVGGPINITCTIGTIVGTAPLTVTSSSGQTQNSMCFKTTGTSAAPGQWAGAGCNVAFTVPSRPAISNPLVFQDGVQRTYGSTTCTPHADTVGHGTGTDNLACLTAAINAGNVEIYAPTGANAGKAYYVSSGIDFPNNRTVICCSDPSGNCTSTSNNYNPRGGSVALRDNATVGADSDLFIFWSSTNRGATCSGSCGTNDTVYGCQVRGNLYNSVGPNTDYTGNKTMISMDGPSSSGDTIAVNDFNGEPGLVGPVNLGDDGSSALGPVNATIQWNTFEYCGTNDIETAAATSLKILHNSSLDCFGWFENNQTAGINGNTNSDTYSNDIAEWNTQNFVNGSAYCYVDPTNPSNHNPAFCNVMSGGISCEHGSNCTFNYQGVTLASNVFIGNSTWTGGISPKSGNGVLPAHYFDNLCTAANHCTVQGGAGANYNDGSCTLLSQGCSNQWP